MGWFFSNILSIGSVELWFKFVPMKIPPDPLPKFAIEPISTPPLTTFVLGATIVSTPMVVMITLGDWVTYVLAGCIWISTSVAFEIFSEV